MLEIAVEDPAVVEVVTPTVEEIPEVQAIQPSTPPPTITQKENNNSSQAGPVSALSLASIRAKKEMQEQINPNTKEEVVLPTESFNETDLLLYWTKYAQKLGDKGYKIMESLLLINDPTVDGTQVRFELPNEGSKLDFESEKNDLLRFLRSHLHNHDISIEVIVNEAVENKFAFTPQDKYNRLNELNPALDLLRKTFELDI
ncbi:MAG: DNA polymerase III subunit gamma/tau [Flavobacterium sp.]